MAQPQQGFYFFYSNQCPHSQRILQRLRGHPVLNVLTLICIDDPRIQIPPFIDAVPALFLQQQKQLLKDNQLLAWVEQMVGGGGNGRPPQQMQAQMQMRQPMPQQQAMPQQPNRGNMPGQMMMPPQQSNVVNMADITGDPSISAFQSNEMLSGVGTSYSFIEDSQNENLFHNYGFLDDRDTSKIPAITRHEGGGVSGGAVAMQQMGSGGFGGETGGKKGKGLKSSGMDNAYEKLMQQRNADVPNPMGNMRF